MLEAVVIKVILLMLSAALFEIGDARAQNFWEPCNGSTTSVSALAMSQSGTLYAAVGSGVYISHGGGSWTRSTGSVSAGVISSLGIDGNSPLFAATDSGVFYSSDYGNSWLAPDSGLIKSYFRSLVVVQNNAVFACSDSGVFRSTDNGRKWMRVYTGPIEQTVTVLGVPTSSKVFGGTHGGGIYVTSDGGDNWSATGDTHSTAPITCILGNQNGSLFVGTYGNGMIRSLNAGTSWEKLSITGKHVYAATIDQSRIVDIMTDSGWEFSTTPSGMYWYRQAGVPNASGLVVSPDIGMIASSFNGLFRFDGSSRWTPLLPSLQGVEIDPISIRSGATIFAGAGYYAARSTNQGKSWEATGRVPWYVSIGALTANTSGTVFAGFIDGNGTGGIYRSFDNGRNWDSTELGIGDITMLTCSSQGTLFAGTRGGAVLRSTDNGNRWTDATQGALGGVEVISLECRGNGAVFAGTHTRIYRSTDNGDSWIWIDSMVMFDGWRFLALKGPHTVFAGANGGVLRSTDDGNSWQLTNNGLARGYPTSLIVNSSGFVFVATDSGVFQSTNDGDNWMNVTGGLNKLYTGLYHVASLAIDSEGILFAGTPFGVFRSSQSTTMLSVVENSTHLSHDLALEPTYPNPVSQGCSMSFSFVVPAFASLKLFDATGREVAVLASGFFDAGEHEVTFDRGTLPGGVYFCRLEAGGQSAARAVVILP